MEQLIESGEVANRAELAQIFGLSRARVTQILDLMLLAPDIQEEILFMEVGSDMNRSPCPITERAIHGLANAAVWREQMKAWSALVN